MILRSLTWTEGNGVSAQLTAGRIDGSRKTTLLSFPYVKESDQSITYLKSANKYYFVRENRLMEFDPSTSQSKQISPDYVKDLTKGPRGTIVFATTKKAIKEYSPLKQDTKVLMMTARPIERLTLRLPKRQNYVYYISGESVVKANRDDPKDVKSISRPGATNYNVDPVSGDIYYVTGDKIIMKENFAGGDNNDSNYVQYTKYSIKS